MSSPAQYADCLGTNKAARLLGVSPMTVIRWIEANKMHAHRTLGGHRRIPRSEVSRMQSEMGLDAPEPKTRVLHYTTGSFNYVLLVNPVDLSGEAFRCPLGVGHMNHIEWRALPKPVCRWFLKEMVRIRDESNGGSKARG